MVKVPEHIPVGLVAVSMVAIFMHSLLPKATQ